MINNDRIVPVTATDLVTLYGLILKVGSVNVSALQASDTDGDFSVASNGTYLAAEPVKAMDFEAEATAVTAYFVPAYDYEGFSVAGTKVVASGDVEADGRTLYVATLSSGNVTVAKVGF